MNINGAGQGVPAMPSSGTDMPKTGAKEGDAIEKEIEALKKELRKVKEDKKIPEKERQERVKKLEQKIRELEQQRMKERAESGIQSPQTERAEAAQDSRSSKERTKDSLAEEGGRFDTYQSQSPQSSAGLYKVVRDENGQQVIEADGNQGNPQSQSKEEPKNGAEKPVIVKTTVSTDRADREIDKLKSDQKELKQKIAAAEPEEKERLEQRLAQLEARLRLKDNDTYRRQHAEITEQKTVSRIGE